MEKSPRHALHCDGTEHCSVTETPGWESHSWSLAFSGVQASSTTLTCLCYFLPLPKGTNCAGPVHETTVRSWYHQEACGYFQPNTMSHWKKGLIMLQTSSKACSWKSVQIYAAYILQFLYCLWYAVKAHEECQTLIQHQRPAYAAMLPLLIKILSPLLRESTTNMPVDLC